MFDIEGTAKMSHVGVFTTVAGECTDMESYYFIKGTQTAANGDELYFYADAYAHDNGGVYYEYTYYGWHRAICQCRWPGKGI